MACKTDFASPMSCSKIKQKKNNGWDGREFEKNPLRYNCALVVKKNGVTKHVGMQAKEHGRVSYDWSNKQYRVQGFSSREVAREKKNHWT